MKNSWLLSLLFITHASSSSICNVNEDCVCYSDPLEIQCSSPESVGFEGLVTSLQSDAVKTDCYNMEEFPMHFLPNITFKEETKLIITGCPPPVFQSIAEHLSMTLHRLHFEHFNQSITITKQHFQGLDLKRLVLMKLNFTYLDQEAFSELSNLSYLELANNKNVTLTPRLFQNLTNLNTLYLTQNQLEEIPDGLFNSLKRLKQLFLWNNKLKTIGDLTFAPLINLTFLDLNTNKIENISEKAFANLSRLSQINLSGNKLKTIPRNFFQNNTKLVKILLTSNRNLRLDDYVFANLKQLKEVSLERCNLTLIPEHVFENSTNLSVIDLQNNNLREIPAGLFEGLKNLEKLFLQKNSISRIDVKPFKDLTKLKELYLQNNIIKEIHQNALSNKYKLKILDLSYNNYTDVVSVNLLEEAMNVVSLDLSHNRISNIGKVISPHSTVGLEILDLSYNLITELELTTVQSMGDLYVCLDHNNITKVNFDDLDQISGDTTSTLSLIDNPLECDCHTHKLQQFLKGEIYSEQASMFIIKNATVRCKDKKPMNLLVLPPSLLTCNITKRTSGCPQKCDCYWRPSDNSIVVDCKYRNLTEFPSVNHELMSFLDYNQTEIDLNGNNLTEVPGRNVVGYENVTRLFLSGNRIKKVEWLPPKIQTLHLDNNELTSLSYSVLKTLNSSTLRNLTLYKNQWNCDCQAVNLANFLREHTAIINADNIPCYGNSSKLLVNLGEADLCNTKLIFYILIPILSVCFIVAVILVVFYRFQQEIKVWLFAHGLWWRSPDELDHDKKYDAFICFSHKDEDFIMENLLPVLESDPDPYTLCIHHRDFVPGEFISTQVTNAVLQSRRTVIILSSNFLESNWGKMEFRTAHIQAMTEGRARVIIVLYGDIDVDKVDEELKAYMKTNTYVKWGDPYFWNKMKYALPHRPRQKTQKKEQKITNVLNCIDDKFRLVGPVKSSPGTTPPVFSLENEVLKKHPLDFAIRQEVNTAPAESGTLMISTY